MRFELCCLPLSRCPKLCDLPASALYLLEFSVVNVELGNAHKAHCFSDISELSELPGTNQIILFLKAFFLRMC